jgi:hypothetical protein
LTADESIGGVTGGVVGELAERLSLLVVEVQSPDGGLTAIAHGRDDIRVSFAVGSYQSYRAGVLARQMEALATLLWAGYRRRYMEVVTAWADRDEGPESTAEDREFERRLAGLRVVGSSPRGWLTLRSRALVSWQVEIAGDPVGSLSEHEFLAELDGAVRDVLADHRAKLIRLTDAVYDIGMPRAMRAVGRGTP